jgi:acyl carrier protein
MVTDVEIREQLKKQVSNQAEIPVEDIDEDVHLADLGIDSLQALQLLVMLERTYRISIGEQELQKFTTITHISNLVLERIEQASASSVA